MSIYLVRHGETIWNTQKRLQGHLDSPLTLKGVGLAVTYGEALRDALSRADDLVLESSPLGRAWQTATAVAGVMGVEPGTVRLDTLLAEHDVGEFAGYTWPEIRTRYGIAPPTFHTWDYQPPSGEPRASVFARAKRWLATVDGDATTLVFTHGGFSRMLRGAYLGLGPEETMALDTHEHGRFYVLSDGTVEAVVVDESARIDEARMG